VTITVPAQLEPGAPVTLDRPCQLAGMRQRVCAGRSRRDSDLAGGGGPSHARPALDAGVGRDRAATPTENPFRQPSP